ncbi:hypothetical protein C6N75_22670 [Streptomyces solincola]|uniref:Gas vesicle protein n=1 Tax=Streptomyces solincola TaxID=2100817 RepID=A0A2S9PRD7_9ACTN|nr:hypothetical protein C6N75_22670 [Streptomyces solincola]
MADTSEKSQASGRDRDGTDEGDNPDKESARKPAAKKTAARKTTARKTTARKTTSSRSGATRTRKSTTASTRSAARNEDAEADEPEELDEPADEPQEQEEEPEPAPRKKPKAMQVVRGAAGQLNELTGLEAESVSSFERTDDGWTVHVEVLELARVPETMSLLATYEVQLDDDGDLTGYKRVRRYERGRADRS